VRDDGALAQQVRRMLNDPKSEALVKNFAGQWLFLRNLQSVAPNEDEFPNFDDSLRQAMRRETELFFESMMREDRNVLDLLNADYTFVNDRLAGARPLRPTLPSLLTQRDHLPRLRPLNCLIHCIGR
jgi:hypothetical protein